METLHHPRMLPETHPLIDAVTKPLAGNAEQQLAARVFLEENFDPEHPKVAKTLERFQELDNRRRIHFWKWLLVCLAGISVGVLAIQLTPKIKAVLTLNSYLGSSTIFTPPPASPRKDLSPEQNLLLGDPRKSSLEQKQDLIQSDPSRPDFYADYLSEYLSVFKKLPEDYFETVARIDPDNAFFLYVGAAVIGKDSVERISRSSLQKEKKEPIQYEILDEARLDEAMGLVHKARSLPKFNNYFSSLLATRIPLLKQRDVTEKYAAIGYVAGHLSSSIRLRELAEMIAAQAARLSENKDDEALKGLLSDNEHLLRTWGMSPVGSLVDELVFSVVATSTTTATFEAAENLGLTREAESLAERKLQFDERMEWRKRKDRPDQGDLITPHGGLLHGLTLPMVSRQVQKPMPISKADLKPGRLVDHEIASQILAAIACIILVVATSAVFLFRFRAPAHFRKISVRIEQLLNKTDWAWILAGVILPFIYVISVNRFTPLGGRDYGIKGLGMVFPFIHYSMLLLAILTAPVLMIRWRLRKKTEALGFAHRKSGLGWMILFLGLALVVGAYPIATSMATGRGEIRLLFIIPFIWEIAIFVTCCRALFGKSDLRVTRAATASALAPAYALGIMLLASLNPVFTASERHWNSNDRLMTLDPRYPGMTPYEYKIGVQLRKEINAILGFGK